MHERVAYEGKILVFSEARSRFGRGELLLIPTRSPLPQHQLCDLQGVKGSSLQELVAAAPER